MLFLQAANLLLWMYFLFGLILRDSTAMYNKNGKNAAANFRKCFLVGEMSLLKDLCSGKSFTHPKKRKNVKRILDKLEAHDPPLNNEQKELLKNLKQKLDQIKIWKEVQVTTFVNKILQDYSQNDRDSLIYLYNGLDLSPEQRKAIPPLLNMIETLAEYFESTDDKESFKLLKERASARIFPNEKESCAGLSMGAGASTWSPLGAGASTWSPLGAGASTWSPFGASGFSGTPSPLPIPTRNVLHPAKFTLPQKAITGKRSLDEEEPTVLEITADLGACSLVENPSVRSKKKRTQR